MRWIKVLFKSKKQSNRDLKEDNTTSLKDQENSNVDEDDILLATQGVDTNYPTNLLRNITFNFALESARFIKEFDTRSDVLAGIATSLHKAGFKVESRQVFKAAIGFAQKSNREGWMGSIETRDCALSKAGRLAVQADFVNEALLAAKSISKPNIRSEVLSAVAEYYALNHDLSKALSIFRDIRKEHYRYCDVLLAISRAYTREGKVEKAEEYIEKIFEHAYAQDTHRDRIYGLLFLANPEVEDRGVRIKSIELALKELESCPRAQKAWTLMTIANSQLKLGMKEKALGLITKAADEIASISDNEEEFSKNVKEFLRTTADDEIGSRSEYEEEFVNTAVDIALLQSKLGLKTKARELLEIVYAHKSKGRAMPLFVNLALVESLIENDSPNQEWYFGDGHINRARLKNVIANATDFSTVMAKIPKRGSFHTAHHREIISAIVETCAELNHVEGIVESYNFARRIADDRDRALSLCVIANAMNSIREQVSVRQPLNHFFRIEAVFERCSTLDKNRIIVELQDIYDRHGFMTCRGHLWAEMNKYRIHNGLGAVPPADSRFFDEEDRNREARFLGGELAKLGSIDLMRGVAGEIKEKFDTMALRDLETAWNGIGDWIA